MSGKRIVELCEHGVIKHLPGIDCDGGRTLTEGQYVLIEKVNGSWPYVLSDNIHRILDALSDHTEGTP